MAVQTAGLPDSKQPFCHAVLCHYKAVLIALAAVHHRNWLLLAHIIAQLFS